VTSPASGAGLPDYAPIPRSALGPARNDQGYYVGPVQRNLYWVTDGLYQSAFLATRDGVVVFDAPPSIGGNIRRAVDEVTAAEGVTNTVTHFVYSHHHADHGGAAFLFDGDVVRIGHEETRRLLLRDNSPARPEPEVTFADRYTLEVGGERVELAWHGPNHSPDNIYIYFPGHDTLMFIDVVNAGWVPVYNLNLSEDVPGYMAAPVIALSYPWTHFISGHLGRLATPRGRRDPPAVHRRHRSQCQGGAGRGQPGAVLRGGRGKRLGRGQGLPRRGHRARGCADHRQVHRRAGRRGHRDLHPDHDVRHHAVAAPGPRAQRTGPSMTRTHPGPVRAGPGLGLAAGDTPVPGPCPRSSACARPGTTTCGMSTPTCRYGARSRWPGVGSRQTSLAIGTLTAGDFDGY
jgi:glyoxylase-like metal-dependent hydrolase (beta-lactamase superfamily II)